MVGGHARARFVRPAFKAARRGAGPSKSRATGPTGLSTADAPRRACPPTHRHLARSASRD